MKNIKFFGLASTLILASATGFTSCSSDSADPIGGTGVAGQVVKTQFYINIPYSGNSTRTSTRMTDVNTQNTSDMATNFLGLANMEMFAFGKTPANGEASTRTIRIGDGTNGSQKDNWRRIYSDIAIPVGTSNLVLYTRASKANNKGGEKSKFQAGYLTNPYVNFNDEAKPNLSDLNFNLGKIYGNTDFATDGETIVTQLNKIAASSGTNASEVETSWSELGTPSNNEEKILQQLYTKFITMKAGSANSVKSFITNLKTAIEEQNLQLGLASAIKTNCEQALTALSGNSFPRDKQLPDGVAKLTFNSSTNSFSYEVAISTTGGNVSAGTNLLDYKTVTYPSELAYFVSSPVKTSTENKTALNDLPNYNAWLNGSASWNGYGDKVQTNTVFVALENPVQYGVACLKSTIKCDKAQLEDNAQKIIKTASNNTISVDNKSFPVTGILIGGQPEGVAWNFEPAASADFKYTIYDQDMNKGNEFTAKVNSTSEQIYNYTLVLDNKDNSGNGTQSNVNVTIELENNAADFYGAEGLIPHGSRFYLVGTLDLTKKPTDTSIDHVFVKDHTTVANFTIKDLKKAYNCIPDMRNSKINVGLAVDLDWKTGITFDVEI